MRALLVGASGFLVFWGCFNSARRLLLGPDRLDFSPVPTLALWYARWLLTVAASALLAAIASGLSMWRIWWMLARKDRSRRR